MRKRLILILVPVFLLMLGMFFYVSILNRGSSNEMFPHYQQALIKYNGTIYASQNTPVDIALIFIDENELSEMASAENIKDIKLIDKSGQIYESESWTIQQGMKEEDYLYRNIQIKLSFNNIGLYEFNLVSIEYADNKIEEYDVGYLDIKVIDLNNENYSGEFDLSCDWITNHEAITQITGLMINLDNFSKFENVTVLKVEMGTKDFQTLNEKTAVFDGTFDSNKIQELMLDDEDLYGNYTSLMNINQTNSSNMSLQLKYDFDTGNRAVLIVPLSSQNNFDYHKYITLFTLEMTIEVNGEIYHCYTLNTLYRIPIGINDTDYDPVQYLKENGV